MLGTEGGYAISRRQLDQQLATIAQAAAVGGRRCSLWLHTSGRHSLDVLQGVGQLGVRTGSLHPVLPFSGSVEGVDMRGAPAVIAGEPRSMRLLKRLAAMLELQAIEWRGVGEAAGAAGAAGEGLLAGAARWEGAAWEGLWRTLEAHQLDALPPQQVGHALEHGPTPAHGGDPVSVPLKSLERGPEAALAGHTPNAFRDRPGPGPAAGRAAPLPSSAPGTPSSL